MLNHVCARKYYAKNSFDCGIFVCFFFRNINEKKKKYTEPELKVKRKVLKIYKYIL